MSQQLRGHHVDFRVYADARKRLWLDAKIVMGVSDESSEFTVSSALQRA